MTATESGTTQPGAHPSVDDRALLEQIATELQVAPGQVRAAVELLDAGSTVPFIARYRKEATGGLDDAQLRELEDRLRYLRELAERRSAILDSIRSQGKLDAELEAQLQAADTKARLEDLYLPHKPKRRTKATIALEAGLEPLADQVLADPQRDPRTEAGAYVDAERGVADVDAALEGARAILVDRFATDAELIGSLRELMWSRGRLTAHVREGQETTGAKYADYFAYSEQFPSLPSHRILALFRGEKDDVLSLALEPDAEPVHRSDQLTDYEQRIARRFAIADRDRPADAWLLATVRWAWRTRILVHLGIDLRTRLRHNAEAEAVRIFAANVRDLLLAAPAGTRPTMGLDPAYRTGVKVAVIDGTGKVAATATVYPHKPQGRWAEALDTLVALVAEHAVELVAVGNGTASRETDTLAAELVQRVTDRRIAKVMVSESGASVYSASSYASRELPDLDVSLRGAVSIARRLQDPLAELVKIDPKSIGVGQYQHDVSEVELSRALDAVVEDCVNAVGVDVNTASAPLLARVSGITTSLAENVVTHRDSHGRFHTRQALRAVPRLGPKAFEQCAGFLRISNGDDPLDASSVHPEAYPVVRRILDAQGTGLSELIGNPALLRPLDPNAFVDDTFGLPTVTDILAELEKPGRDPRPRFQAASFAEGVNTIEDLASGMVVEGVVTNVAAFGAFVDVGVHQDGLVHISAMAKTFVNDPHAVVKPGAVVRVKVLGVDVGRRRISLTMRLDDEIDGRDSTGDKRVHGGESAAKKASPAQQAATAKKPRSPQQRGKPAESAPDTALADALRRAGMTK